MTKAENSVVHKENNLTKSLLELQKGGYTGAVKVSSKCTGSKYLHYFCFLQDGDLTFANQYIPTNRDLVNILGKSLKLGYVDSLLDFVSRRVDLDRGSTYEVLNTIVSTKAITWEDIEKFCLQRVLVILERLLPHACTIDVLANVRINLGFGDSQHRFSCKEVLQQLAQRQKKWRQYAPVIRSLEDIPVVHDSVLQAVTHKATLVHLEKWVDGQRTIADIAEALEQDPLVLAPLYYHWVEEGLIEIRHASSPSETKTKTVPVILSVDDSPIVQSMLRKTLSSDYEVICASSAMEALGILNRTQVDLILLDVTMPEIDGFEFCRTIRKISKFKDTPVIMLTAKDGLIDRARGHLAGTNRYLTKPINQDELLAAIREHLQD
ncbi:MAG: response regulator [Pseudanabaenaceae cyanobacterium SKYGB_i_bin29]|nr:response regulator [Pseudanabaenaceae cyanobacterium SKYG29]MDW8422040.1 response regulator [Pseudanabaenaceae cyanobacterium SKYGB_i_bin29]